MPLTTYRTLLQLRQDVISRLDEAVGSPIGQLLKLSDGTTVEDTDPLVTRYLNEGARDLCRSCYPMETVGTGPVPANTTFLALGNISTAASSVVWAVRGVFNGTTRLKRCNRSYGDLYSASAGPLAYWYPEGGSGIGVAAAPTVDTTLTVTGFALPPAMVADTDTPAWLEPDLDKLLVFYAAAMVASKAVSDAVMGPRATIWMGQYQEGRLRQWERLMAQDPALAKAHFPSPDVAEREK